MAVKSWKDEGDRLYKASDFQGAVEKYTKAIKSTIQHEDPDIYLCYSNRCACYLQLLDYQSALSDANSCIRLKPVWPKGYNRKGSCLVHLKRLDEAYEVYERAIELDSNNTEALNALTKLRTSSSNSNRTNTNNNNNTPSFFSTIQNRASEFIQQLSTMDTSAIFASISAFFSLIYFQCSNYWNSLHPDTRKYITIGGGLLLAYYFFIYRGLSSQNYYPDSYSQYSGGGYGYGYGQGGGGLSWTMWAAIMGAAYKLPPMFPDQLGEYARPFFGMSWTTFMWLLNMVTSNRGGGGRFGGGGYGGGGFGGRRGGMFGRRY